MRTIERTSQFKRDWKREGKGQHAKALRTTFIEVVTALADDQPLAHCFRDHALSGDWADHRNCHVRPDLVLIYRKPDATRLQLVRLGSHAELGW